MNPINAMNLINNTTTTARILSENADTMVDLPTALTTAGLAFGAMILIYGLIWFGIEYHFNFFDLWSDIEWKLWGK